MPKRVLIITYYWPPAGGGGVQRWVKFVKYLRDFGWEPIVFTVENGDYPILDPTLIEEVPDNIEVIKQAIIEPYTWYRKFTGKSKDSKIDANFLSQGKKLSFLDKLAVWIRGNMFIPDARILWVRPSAKTLIQYLANHPVDAMISTGPPHSCHLIASHIKTKIDIPWIVDYRDPWTQIDYFDDLRLTYFARKRHQNLEKHVLNQCNRIVCIGKTMASDLKSITNTKTTVITNGYDESDIISLQTVLDKKFTITYIGTMNASRNPEILWKAIQKLKSEKHEMMSDISINLVGNPEAIIKQSITAYGLDHLVNLVGYVNHGEAIKYQNSAQLLLLIINKTTNNKSILTGKIFEYLASGRPIICIGPKDGDAAEIINSSASGVMIEYEDTEQLISYLKLSYDLYLNHKLTNQSKGIEMYSRRNLTGKLADILNEISGKL
ncbi:MAG: glycosyltransferase family 4 protein [Saprospiraceae bacterium]|nr:glycosyltransferase family 4 protein [Saprospiraceae bacterium]